MNDDPTTGHTLVEEVSSGRLGERVRALRRERGWTLEMLAEGDARTTDFWAHAVKLGLEVRY